MRLANIKELPSDVFKDNKCLRSVDLRNNKLTHLPKEICNLPSLWKLRVDYNYLQELPSQLGYLPHLQFLSAS